MPVRSGPPPLGTNHFRVIIGRRELGFSEVSRLSSETDVDPFSEDRFHGYETVVLRRALSTSTELYDWRRKIAQGKDDRRDVTIHQLASAGGAIVNSWRLEGAWPCRWSGPPFDALSGDVAIEELELAYDDLIWLKPEPTRSRTKTEGA